MSALLLRLEGPLQSWGTRSRFSHRDTMLDPSLSGVIGLLCCALGHDRAQGLDLFSGLRLHVREDKPGRLLTDFHTAGGGVFRSRTDYYAPTASGGKGENPVVTHRDYLMDASFLVAVAHDDAGRIARFAEAVQDPVWPLALGRRSCPPSAPVYVTQKSDDGIEALQTMPILAPSLTWPQNLLDERRRRWRPEETPPSEEPAPTPTVTLRLVVQTDSANAHETRQDVPLAWADRIDRRYGHRFVKTEHVDVPRSEVPA